MAIGSFILLLIGFVANQKGETYNPLLYVGYVFSCMTLFYGYVSYLSVKRYFKEVNKLAQSYDGIGLDCVFEFSDDSVKYSDKEKEVNLKWSLFSYYSIYKGFLVLVYNDSIISSYLFENTKEYSNEYERVLEFAKLKLEFKDLN